MSDTIGKKSNIKILLLTNRDSDNVGDQVIEACDISLLSAVMDNLFPKDHIGGKTKAKMKTKVKKMLGADNSSHDGTPSSRYEINSRAASIVTQAYLKKKDPALLETARKAVKKCDIVVFGGAPLFNYSYQNFYERTAITLELAEEYGKPVIFSAIGVEAYSEDSEKCQRLKKTLNFPCVKQITTRDDFDYLTAYKEKEDLVIDKVADPAVFTSTVFRNYIKKRKLGMKKKIGVFILRANGFVDNKVDFDKNSAAHMWKDLIAKLEEKGYDYELITSGHFGDEAFLDYLIRNYGIPEKKCIFNMNCPEQLIEKISKYDGVISCRLHPSIISFSLDVPGVGLVWNNKVRRFYECIGYEDRIIGVEDFNADCIMEKLELSMKKGVKKDKDYLYTVYRSLFDGLKRIILGEDDTTEPYTYEQLMDKIPAFMGTPDKEKELKLKRKFRRTYNTCNDRLDKNEKLQKDIKELKAKK